MHIQQNPIRKLSIQIILYKILHHIIYIIQTG